MLTQVLGSLLILSFVSVSVRGYVECCTSSDFSPPDCDWGFDVIMLIDESTTVSSTDFALQISFVKDLLDELDSDFVIGIIAYGDNARTIWNLNDIQTNRNLIKTALNNMVQDPLAGNGIIQSGTDAANVMFDTQTTGWHPVLLLFSDTNAVATCNNLFANEFYEMRFVGIDGGNSYDESTIDCYANYMSSSTMHTLSNDNTQNIATSMCYHWLVVSNGNERTHEYSPRMYIICFVFLFDRPIDAKFQCV